MNWKSNKKIQSSNLEKNLIFWKQVVSQLWQLFDQKKALKWPERDPLESHLELSIMRLKDTRKKNYKDEKIQNCHSCPHAGMYTRVYILDFLDIGHNKELF